MRTAHFMSNYTSPACSHILYLLFTDLWTSVWKKQRRGISINLLSNTHHLFKTWKSCCVCFNFYEWYKVVRLAFEFMRLVLVVLLVVNTSYYHTEISPNHIVTLVSLHLIRDIHLEIESKVVERGPCKVVRLVRVVQLVKSRNSLETLTICEQSCREGGCQ